MSHVGFQDSYDPTPHMPPTHYEIVKARLDEAHADLFDIYTFMRESNYNQLGVEELLDAVLKPIRECHARMRDAKRSWA